MLALKQSIPEVALQAIASRRHGSFDDCYETNIRPQLGRLVSVARGILGSEDLAWDAVQNSLVTLWRQDYLPSNVPGWLRQAVRNRSLQLLRTRSRQRKYEERASQRTRELSGRDEPCRALLAKEFQSDVENALAELSDEHRLVFVRREIHDQDYEAIAHDLQIPVGTVRSRLNRSRAALRQILQRMLRIGDRPWNAPADAGKAHGK